MKNKFREGEFHHYCRLFSLNTYFNMKKKLALKRSGGIDNIIPCDRCEIFDYGIYRRLVRDRMGRCLISYIFNKNDGKEKGPCLSLKKQKVISEKSLTRAKIYRNDKN